MRLRPIFKPVLNRVLPPLTRWYLRKERRFRHLGLDLLIHPGVFHPGFFFSTKYMAEHIGDWDLKGKSVLELGAGSGFLSLLCASKGAVVTASDISPLATENIRVNAARNGLSLRVVESDLFEALPPHPFDLVLINPPYYPGTPSNMAEHAWYCGPEWEYFQRLFEDLGDYKAASGQVLMVVSEDVAVREIGKIAAGKGWRIREVDRSKRWGEWNLIFALEQA